MNDLKNDPSGGTLWRAKEADPQQSKPITFHFVCGRPLQTLVSTINPRSSFWWFDQEDVAI